jgi:hypothetical protein
LSPDEQHPDHLAEQVMAGGVKPGQASDGDAVEPWTRSGFANLFGFAWLALAAISIVRWAFDWDRHGVWFWIPVAPLLLVEVLSGAAWITLTIREGVQTRGRALVPDWRTVLGLGGIFIVAFLLPKLTG